MFSNCNAHFQNELFFIPNFSFGIELQKPAQGHRASANQVVLMIGDLHLTGQLTGPQIFRGQVENQDLAVRAVAAAIVPMTHLRMVISA